MDGSAAIGASVVNIVTEEWRFDHKERLYKGRTTNVRPLHLKLSPTAYLGYISTAVGRRAVLLPSVCRYRLQHAAAVLPLAGH